MEGTTLELHGENRFGDRMKVNEENGGSRGREGERMNLLDKEERWK
tara:strand:+ start:914 stop:1051 length:138 start_codon:yes stop_codon:yes gene_type:complete